MGENTHLKPNVNHYETMCKTFRSELLCVLERLHILCLGNFNNEFEIPESWGSLQFNIPSATRALLSQHIKSLVSWKEISKSLKDETDFQGTLMNETEPSLPSTLFLAPSDLVISRKDVDPLFPELDIAEEILAEYLPFEMSAVKNDISNTNRFHL